MKKSTHKITLFITCLLALCLVCGFAMAVPVFAVTSGGNYEVYFDANGGYFVYSDRLAPAARTF